MEMLGNISFGVFFLASIYGLYLILRLIICLVKGNDERDAWIKKIKIVLMIMLSCFLLFVAKDGLEGILCAVVFMLFLVGVYMFVKLIISLFKGQDRMKYLKRTGLCGVLNVVLILFIGSTVAPGTNATPTPTQSQNISQQLEQNQIQPQQNQNQNQSNQSDIDFDRDRNRNNNNNRPQSNTQPPRQTQTSQPRPATLPSNTVSNAGRNKGVVNKLGSGGKILVRVLSRGKIKL